MRTALIVVAYDTTDHVDVLVARNIGSFSHRMTYATGNWPNSVAVGDFNNDNLLDIVITNNRDNTVSVLLGYGDGSFANQTKYATGTSPWSIAV
ncbi:unnamed protein product, partial [Rotaria sp. Silwood1]